MRGYAKLLMLKKFMLLGAIILGIGGIIAIIAAIMGTGEDTLIFGFFAPFLLIFSVMAFLMLKANVNRFVIDMKKDTLEYPGGGIAAPSFFSYFSPAFWFQGFKRYTLTISDIQSIKQYDETKARVSKEDYKVRTTTTYLLNMNGKFGAIPFRFSTEGKRDELYTLIAQMNEMGSPILNR